MIGGHPLGRNPSLRMLLITASIGTTAIALLVMLILPLWQHAHQVDRSEITLNMVAAIARGAVRDDGRIDGAMLDRAAVLRHIRTANPALRLYIETDHARYGMGAAPHWRERLETLRTGLGNGGRGRCGVETLVMRLGDGAGQGIVSADYCRPGSLFMEIGGIRQSTVGRADIFWNILWSELPRYWQSLALIALVLGTVIFAIFYAVTGSIRQLADTAAGFQPGVALRPLSEGRVPRELLPLVRSVNKALAQVDDAMNRQKAFTGAAAHELRTPLAILSGRLAQLPEGQIRSNLERDAARMSTIITQLLKLSSWRAVDPHLDSVDLNGIVRDICIEYAPIALDAGMSLAFEEQAQVRVDADPEILRIAISNLLENALMHSPVGQAVEFSVTEAGAVTVRDHGPGVPPENWPHLFKPFFKDPPNKPGAGLGLAIVAEAMAAHGGRVSGDNAEGGGTIFTLSFPDRTLDRHR